eukprot:TRINITY_DN857_c0_g1_i7.p1 TRINITY_DN857_c0_g1~~TRINITY_DN857_c0_g1_i7.p1  ORF type:complete len:236 (+),score=10.50 TRINITY_DN857_c0_g1_i7:51-710(+)
MFWYHIIIIGLYLGHQFITFNISLFTINYVIIIRYYDSTSMASICMHLFLMAGVVSAQTISIGPNVTNSSFYEFKGALNQFSNVNLTTFSRGFVVDSGNATDLGNAASVLVAQFESFSNDNQGTAGVGLNSIEVNVNGTESLLDLNSFQISSGNTSAFSRIQGIGAVENGNNEGSFLLDVQSVDGGRNAFALAQGYGDTVSTPFSSLSNTRLCAGNQCP